MARLLAARTGAKLTRDEVASRLAAEGQYDINPLTIRNWEKGVNWPRDPEMVERVADLLGVTWQRLFFDEAEIRPTPKEALAVLADLVERPTPRAVDLAPDPVLGLLAQLSVAQRKSVVGSIEKLVARNQKKNRSDAG